MGQIDNHFFATSITDTGALDGLIIICERVAHKMNVNCHNCGTNPCCHQCEFSVHYYSPERERQDDALYGMDAYDGYGDTDIYADSDEETRENYNTALIVTLHNDISSMWNNDECPACTHYGIDEPHTPNCNVTDEIPF